MITEDIYNIAYDLYINNKKNNYKDVYQTSTFLLIQFSKLL
jgi:hypothetical protein